MAEYLATASPVEQVELVDHAVLRAAAWPIETLSLFEAPQLARTARAVLRDRAVVLKRRDAGLAILEQAVPLLGDRAARAYLLSVKRHIFSQLTPFLPPTPMVAERLSALPAVSHFFRREEAARVGLAKRTAELERAHAATLERQREALYRACREPDFLKALAVANPVLAANVSTVDSVPSGERARGRRLDATLFHYLMRACGRPTPNGAWAGVAPIAPGHGADRGRHGLTVGTGMGSYDVAPDLLSFRLMLRTLAGLPRYRVNYPLRRNPTLLTTAEGYRYERDRGGTFEWTTLPAHPLYSAILDQYRDGEAHPGAPIVSMLASLVAGGDKVRLKFAELLDSLIERDVLRPDLGLPPRAESAWDALDAVVPKLVEPDRSAWLSAMARLRALCTHLGDDYERLRPAEVLTVQRQIADEVQRLWSACGLTGAPPGPFVRLDRGLPFTVRWNSTARAKATRAVQTLLRFYAANGAAELWRRQQMHQVVRAMRGEAVVSLIELLAQEATLGPQTGAVHNGDESSSATDPITWEALFSALPATSQMERRARDVSTAWQRVLEQGIDRRILFLPDPASDDTSRPGPAGCALLRVDGAGRVWLGPARPEAGALVARFTKLLLKSGDGAGDALTAAIRRRDRVAAETGQLLAEIVGWNPRNPNAALRPIFTTVSLDPHGHEEPTTLGLSLELDPEDLRPRLRSPEFTNPLVPTYNSAANIGEDDRCSALLLVLAGGHGWEFPAFTLPPLEIERTAWLHLPRLTLPGGNVLSPERWLFDRPTIAALEQISGAIRYLGWRQQVSARRMPAVVHVRRDLDSSQLVMRTDSPLAVRCLFDTFAAGADSLIFTELPSGANCSMVVAPNGRHYLAEIAVMWYDDSYWSAILPQDSVHTDGP